MMKFKSAISTSALLSVLAFVSAFCITARATMTYGVGIRNNKGVYQVNFATGGVTEVFKTPDMEWYGATDGDCAHPGTFYATGNGGSLYRIDVVNKNYTAVGDNGYNVPAVINGLAYDEDSGILYGTDYKNLFSIDTTPGSPTEGQATLIGNFGISDNVWAFDYDASNDKLVALANTRTFGTETYHIDPITGDADLIGHSLIGRITDIWYDETSGKTFGISNDPTTGTGKLYEVNTTTGCIVKTDCIRYDLLGLGKPCGNPVPEPGTVLLFGLGAAMTMLKKRRYSRGGVV